MSIDVFMSVGTPHTATQESFIEHLELLLSARGLAPRTVGRNDFSSKAPLARVQETLAQCHGTVVVALERSIASEFVDKPGSQDEMAQARVRLPTVWNQIEAAMSYTRGLPLMVLVEKGLRDEGLLAQRYDWYVQWIEVSDGATQTAEFQGVLGDWVKQVHDHLEQPQTHTRTQGAESLTLGQILTGLTVQQAWAALGAVATLLVSVAAIAFKLGTAAG